VGRVRGGVEGEGGAKRKGGDRPKQVGEHGGWSLVGWGRVGDTAKAPHRAGLVG
jgi:hypothetical protein